MASSGSGKKHTSGEKPLLSQLYGDVCMWAYTGGCGVKATVRTWMTHSAGSHRQAGTETKTARRKGREEGPDPRQKSPGQRAGTAARQANTRKEHTKHRQDRTEREAGGRQAKASEATKRGRTGEQTDRQTRRRRGETTASERTKAKARNTRSQLSRQRSRSSRHCLIAAHCCTAARRTG